MRILKLCYEYPPLGGGGGRVVSGLSRQLANMGHCVDLITMGYKGLHPFEKARKLFDPPGPLHTDKPHCMPRPGNDELCFSGASGRLEDDGKEGDMTSSMRILFFRMVSRRFSCQKLPDYRI